MNNNFKFFLYNLCVLMVLNLHTNSHGTESEDLPIGIENPAQNCFANSSLQLLVSIPNYHIKTTNLILTEEEGIQLLRETVGVGNVNTQEDPSQFISKLFEQDASILGEQHYFNGDHAKLSHKDNSHNLNPWFPIV